MIRGEDPATSSPLIIAVAAMISSSDNDERGGVATPSALIMRSCEAHCLTGMSRRGGCRGKTFRVSVRQ